MATAPAAKQRHDLFDDFFRAVHIPFEIQPTAVKGKIDPTVVLSSHAVENFAPDLSVPIDFTDRYHNVPTPVWLI
jgi:hypothetical protein